MTRRGLGEGRQTQQLRPLRKPIGVALASIVHRPSSMLRGVTTPCKASPRRQSRLHPVHSFHTKVTPLQLSSYHSATVRRFAHVQQVDHLIEPMDTGTRRDGHSPASYPPLPFDPNVDAQPMSDQPRESTPRAQQQVHLLPLSQAAAAASIPTGPNQIDQGLSPLG